MDESQLDQYKKLIKALTERNSALTQKDAENRTAIRNLILQLESIKQSNEIANNVQKDVLDKEQKQVIENKMVSSENTRLRTELARSQENIINLKEQISLIDFSKKEASETHHSLISKIKAFFKRPSSR